MRKLEKKIVFLTGTRADFGKLKALIDAVEQSDEFDAYLFVTGMHLLEKYGATVNEILKNGYRHVQMYNNSSSCSSMDMALANTINGFGQYVKT